MFHCRERPERPAIGSADPNATIRRLWPRRNTLSTGHLSRSGRNGASMETSGGSRQQKSARRPRRRQMKIPANRRFRSRPAAARSPWEGGGRGFESVRGLCKAPHSGIRAAAESVGLVVSLPVKQRAVSPNLRKELCPLIEASDRVTQRAVTAVSGRRLPPWFFPTSSISRRRDRRCRG
jgi:hypothetical protein